MYSAILDLLRTAAKDPVIGVNAMLAATPRNAADDAVPPPFTFIETEFSHQRVLNASPPAQLPALYLCRNAPLVLHGELVVDSYRDAAEPVGVAYRLLTTFTGDDVRAARYNDYYLRAVIRSIAALMQNTHANQASSVTQGIQLYGCHRIIGAPWREDLGGSIITAVVSASFYLRDTAP